MRHDRPTLAKQSLHVRKSTKRHPASHRRDDQVRWLLVRCTILLMFLDPVIYLITRDPAVLAGSNILGLTLLSVFDYYFSRNHE